MSVIRALQKKINVLTSGLFATWLPDDRLDIGDYGTLHRGRFLRDGNLKGAGVLFDQQVSVSEGAAFRYSDGAQILGKLDASMSLPEEAGKASGAINFSKEGGFVYHFYDAKQIRIEKRDEFFRAFVAAVLSGNLRWRDDYVIIDETRECARSWIMISETASGSVKLSGSSKIEQDANLANADVDVSSSVESGSVLDYSSKSVTRPLYHGIKPIFGDGPPGGPRATLNWVMTSIKNLFSEKFPAPTEIYVSFYDDNTGVRCAHAQIKGLETLDLTVSFRQIDIDDLNLDAESASVFEDPSETAVEEIDVNEYVEKSRAAGG